MIVLMKLFWTSSDICYVDRKLYPHLFLFPAVSEKEEISVRVYVND